MAKSLQLTTPVGTVLWDNTRNEDKYGGYSITLTLTDSDEGLEEFKTALLDYQYNTLGPDAPIKHPLLKSVEDKLTIKAKSKYPGFEIVDHDNNPIDDDVSLKGHRARLNINVKEWRGDFGDGPQCGLTAYLKGVQTASDPSGSDESPAFGKIPKEAVESSELPF